MICHMVLDFLCTPLFFMQSLKNEQQNSISLNQSSEEKHIGQSVEITIMWLALNEECDAMVNPNVQRLYVAYTFLGRSGAELETPLSLPKPKSYVDKCYFQFSKSKFFHIRTFWSLIPE